MLGIFGRNSFKRGWGGEGGGREGGNVKPSRKSNFLKKSKMVISVKIRNFSRSWMTKQTSLLESYSEI